jgi:hypothetical protein
MDYIYHPHISMYHPMLLLIQTIGRPSLFAESLGKLIECTSSYCTNNRLTLPAFIRDVTFYLYSAYYLSFNILQRNFFSLSHKGT